MFADHCFQERITLTHCPIAFLSTYPSSPLLVRKLVPEVVVLAMRILQAIVQFLHMLAPIASHTIDNQSNDTSLSDSISTALPPHGAAQPSLLDVVYFCCRGGWVVVGNHYAGRGIIAP